MAFSSEALRLALEQSFAGGGVSDFYDFIRSNLTARRCIIASDYNIDSTDALHDVYAFACYPTNTIDELKGFISDIFPVDFKMTSNITYRQKYFFKNGLCFCFVFLVPRPRTILRVHDTHAQNLDEVRSKLSDALNKLEGRHSPNQLLDLRRLFHESMKRNFSIEILERIFLLATFHAFVTAQIVMRLPVDTIAWFPDRDDMTTYCASAWSGLAFITWECVWRSTYPNQKIPSHLIIDHRVKGIQDIYDPMIRVPDFLAAVLSRWDVERMLITRPPGAKSAAMVRYFRVLLGWLPQNPAMWVARVHFDEQGNPRTGRLISARTRDRLSRPQRSAPLSHSSA